MNVKKILPIHPGEILFEEFLKPMNLSQNMLGRVLGVPPHRINEIVHGKRRITAVTALRLATYFNNSQSFWLGLQMDYDLDVAEDLLLLRIKNKIITPAYCIALPNRAKKIFSLPTAPRMREAYITLY